MIVNKDRKKRFYLTRTCNTAAVPSSSRTQTHKQQHLSAVSGSVSFHASCYVHKQLVLIGHDM